MCFENCVGGKIVIFQMNLIYEATHEAKHDMRTNIGCLSAWSNQGLIAYTVERTLDGRQLMELRIFNSGIYMKCSF